MIDIPSLSFCITCKNRISQIRKTLVKNLNDNRIHKDYIEFVLVDFGSDDGLQEWILTNFKEDLSHGFLRYYYTDELPYWHASIAKNTSHLIAKNEILVNLDCDNYTGYLGGKFVIRNFYQNCMDIVWHQFGGNLADGTYGRIGVLKKYFYRLGGYDESFAPMSFQDNDLIWRFKSLGLKYISNSDKFYNKAITNSKEEGLRFTFSELNYQQMYETNKERSSNNLANGCLIANGNKEFGIRKNIFDHLGKAYKINL